MNYPTESVSTITIFDRKVTLPSPIRRSGHEQPFVDLIGVDALDYVTAPGLSKTQMTRCVSALTDETESTEVVGQAVQLFVFTTVGDGSPSAISLDETHAFSILTSNGDRLEHHYFEKQSASIFEQVPSLSMVLSGPLDMDDVRLLHFAGAGKYGLPPRSTIYEFNAGAWASKNWRWEKNLALRIAILQDKGRNWGASTLGLYGDEIYLALVGTTGSFCGGNRDCPEGTDSTCGTAPGGPDKVCGALGAGGDLLVDISREFKKQGIVPPVPIDFVLLRYLQKSLLAGNGKGRDYISYYYMAAQFAKLDRKTLEEYAEAIPDIHQGMRELLTGSDETVAVTTRLRNLLLDIIRHHRDVQNPAFQQTLDRIERALVSFPE